MCAARIRKEFIVHLELLVPALYGLCTQRFAGASECCTICRMEHKSCFLPGNIALGVKQGAVGGLKADQYLETAEKLAYTCMQFYAQTPTGMYSGSQDS